MARDLPRTYCVISIHALREEGDVKLLDQWEEYSLISIHALREEGDSTHD